MSEQEFIAATLKALEAEYGRGSLFPYPWQIDLPTVLEQKYWAVKAVNTHIRSSAVDRQLRDTWKRVLGELAVEYVDALKQQRDEVIRERDTAYATMAMMHGDVVLTYTSSSSTVPAHRDGEEVQG